MEPSDHSRSTVQLQYIDVLPAEADATPREGQAPVHASANHNTTRNDDGIRTSFPGYASPSPDDTYMYIVSGFDEAAGLSREQRLRAPTATLLESASEVGLMRDRLLYHATGDAPRIGADGNVRRGVQANPHYPRPTGIPSAVKDAMDIKRHRGEDYSIVSFTVPWDRTQLCAVVSVVAPVLVADMVVLIAAAPHFVGLIVIVAVPVFFAVLLLACILVWRIRATRVELDEYQLRVRFTRMFIFSCISSTIDVSAKDLASLEVLGGGCCGTLWSGQLGVWVTVAGGGNPSYRVAVGAEELEVWTDFVHYMKRRLLRGDVLRSIDAEERRGR